MNERKLKEAFGHVKSDFNSLSNDLRTLSLKVDSLSNTKLLAENVKDQLERLDKVNLEKFVVDLESEFKSINFLIQDFNDRFLETSSFVKKFSIELEKYNVELADIKSKLNKTQNTTANTDLDVNLLNERFSELQELLSEKVSLEIGSLRLEFTEELAKVYDRISSEDSDLKKDVKVRKTRAKSTTKRSLSSSRKKEDSSTLASKQIPEPTLASQSEEGKFKKAMKWLFIDEEENELDSIKGEIKNSDSKV